MQQKGWLCCKSSSHGCPALHRKAGPLAPRDNHSLADHVFRAVLDTGATLSIVARHLLKTFKKTKTVAIRVGDGRTIHSLERVDVTICLGDETVTQHCRVLDTDALDIVIGTDFLRRNPEVKMLSLQRPYSLHCDFGRNTNVLGTHDIPRAAKHVRVSKQTLK